MEDNQTVTTPQTVQPAPQLNGDLFAAIAYIPPLFILTAIKEGKNEAHMWHAKNGAGLFAASLVLYVLIQLIATNMPVSILAIMGLVMDALSLAILAAIIYGAWNGWKGTKWEIPYITKYAQKIPLEIIMKQVNTVAANPTPATTSTPTTAPVEPTPVEPVVEPTPQMEPTPEPAPTAAAPVVEPTPAPIEPTVPTPTTSTPPQNNI